MIAGDHDGTHLRLRAEADGFAHAVAGRIHHRHEPQKREAVFEFAVRKRLVAARCVSRGSKITARDSEHTQCLCAQSLGMRDDTGPCVRVERLPPGMGLDRRAERQDGVGAAFRVNRLPAILPDCDHCHAPSRAVERKLANHARRAGDFLVRDAALARESEKRPLGRVSLNAPDAAPERERGAIANGDRFEKFGESNLGQIGARALSVEDVAARLIARAGHREGCARRVDLLHGHFVSRQSSCLVGAHDSRRPERFHRSKLPDDRSALGHALHPKRQCDCRDGRQPFRNGSHREAHRFEQELVPAAVASQHSARKEKRREPQTPPKDSLSE